jgi:N6-L-threonylcarbamoyladenine synthase
MKQDHGPTQGIEPLNAANAHSANLPVAIRKCLAQGQRDGILSDTMRPSEIDAIAVTKGPGMGASLSQGLGNAKLLSTLWNRPIIYVHHMVAHTLTPFLSASTTIKMPFPVLLLSGGHTQLVLCQSPTQFKILANSGDDSIGEAFDKVARFLKVEFDWSKTSPGAALEAFASSRGAEKYKVPVPFRKRPGFS